MYRCYDSRTNLGVDVYLAKYKIIKETPKGKWVGHSEYSKRFVLNNSRKRYAWETKEKAIESFISRKKRQIEILRMQLSDAEMAYDMALNGRIDDLTIDE